VARHRDVQAFDERSADYESGRLGGWHQRIAEWTVDIALARHPTPLHVLDVGCGTGYLLRQLAVRCPDAVGLFGVDPAGGMIEVARSAAAGDERLCFSIGVAEQLAYAAGSFDLVVSTTSFDHWADQKMGLAECARVMAPDGQLVLTDLFSVLFLPTLVVGHRGRARTIRRANALLTLAGLRTIEWHKPSPFITILRAVTAEK
jgi:ubiquinone/menaquinone biosynthesis C-methylase UbiE